MTVNFLIGLASNDIDLTVVGSQRHTRFQFYAIYIITNIQIDGKLVIGNRGINQNTIFFGIQIPFAILPHPSANKGVTR